ncbi:(2,3-dihydroxybenzoyl)adenylate synthase [Kineococcus glutinatus]|uniref:(2,3-dihydroxybenzoyl)adenylate synthase n=1 Tax=Kineococcus glutinatus TaxID=1070872 RepID=A0ABP9HD16_9ACTN
MTSETAVPTTTGTTTRTGDWPGWPVEFAERYRAAGHWSGETFGGLLRERARRFAGRTAVVCGERRWTYADLDARVDRLAAGLAGRGVGRGDRVVVQLPNVAEFLQVLFALFRLGAVPVLALPAHRRVEIGRFLEQSGAVAYVVPGVHGGFDHRELARELLPQHPDLRLVVVVGADVPGGFGADAPGAGGFAALADLETDPLPGPDPDVDPGDLALLQLSGGSTGVPKLIPRTTDDYLYSVRAGAGVCALDPATVYLAVLPVAHNFPLSSPGVLGVLHAGGTVVMCPHPAPDVALPLVARERVTLAALVPPLAQLWLQAAARGAHDLTSLRLLQVGGARLADEVARRVGSVLGCELQQVFGMAEGMVAYTRLDDPEEVRTSTQGRPVSPDDEVRLVDDDDVDVPEGATGHLLVRGPYTIRGYYRAAEHDRTAFTADGYYRTGDLVRRRADGNLVVEGRAKDQVNRGGEKIPVDEVEAVLLAHPAVLDVAVVGLPDPHLGERTCAVVVPVAGAAPTPAQLRGHVRAHGLAAYKVPDRVEVVPAFPHTAVGKVSRRRLRTLLAEQLGEKPAAVGPAT